MTTRLPATLIYEGNPFPYGDSQLEHVLREQHNLAQAGDGTVNWQEMVATDLAPRFTLGSIGRFVHPIYGMIRARYVRFTDWDDSLESGGPVGWNLAAIAAEGFQWQVTNTIMLTAEYGAIGFPARYEPSYNSFGWVIIDGVNVQSVRFQGGEPISGIELMWVSDDLVGEDDGTESKLGLFVGTATDLGDGFWELAPAAILIRT